jgi:steroid 5-alpha reductase family enzyme
MTASFWVFSFLWGVIVSLPHTLGTTSSAPGTLITTSCGTALYMVGLFLETLADIQKWHFKDSNPGKFCNVGLWTISQHPNWLGNLLLWSGIFMLNAPALLQTVDSSKGFLYRIWSAKLMLVALLSPTFLFALFSAQATGGLTPTLELATKKYGSDSEYIKYISTVPLIFPNVMKAFFK